MMVTTRFRTPGALATVTPIAIITAIKGANYIAIPMAKTKIPIKSAQIVMNFTYLAISYSIVVAFFSTLVTFRAILAMRVLSPTSTTTPFPVPSVLMDPLKAIFLLSSGFPKLVH